MLGSLKGMGVKALVRKTLNSDMGRAKINGAVARYGEFLGADFPEDGGITFNLRLKGEASDVALTVRHVEIADDGSSVVATGLGASREWLDLVLKDRVEGTRIPVPGSIAELIPVGMVRDFFA